MSKVTIGAAVAAWVLVGCVGLVRADENTRYYRVTDITNGRSYDFSVADGPKSVPGVECYTVPGNHKKGTTPDSVFLFCNSGTGQFSVGALCKDAATGRKSTQETLFHTRDSEGVFTFWSLACI